MAPSVLVFQKLINVGPAFIPDYRVNLFYILDSNLPAKKLLLGIHYLTFIEHFTKTHDCVRPCKTQESAIVIFCKTLFTLFSLSLSKKILNFRLLHLNLHNFHRPNIAILGSVHIWHHHLLGISKWWNGAGGVKSQVGNNARGTNVAKPTAWCGDIRRGVQYMKGFA